MFNSQKQKRKKQRNTLELKYTTSLEEEIRVKEKLIKLQDKVIALQEENDIYQKELIKKYQQDLEKIKIKYKKLKENK